MRIYPKRLRFESDWFAVDREGKVGFFAGGHAGFIPRAADVGRTADAIDALATAGRAVARGGGAGYRSAAAQTNEPVFDPPNAHEKPMADYPHLVFTEDPVALRGALSDVETIDALASRGAAVLALALGEFSWELLHAEEPLCIGCRAASLIDDPHPRAPELLARAGLYVYAHSGGELAEDYVRVASPSVPADLGDLETIVVTLARGVELPVTFASATSIVVAV